MKLTADGLGAGEPGGKRLGAARLDKEKMQLLRRRILAGFERTLPRRRPTLGYRLAVLVVAVTMALLAVAYVALIVAVLAAVGWHAATNVDVLTWESGGMRSRMGVVFFTYFLPIGVGLILAFFMVKPILARPVRVSVCRSWRRRRPCSSMPSLPSREPGTPFTTPPVR